MHTKFIKVLLIIFGLPTLLLSQTNHGFAFDNYSGIYGVVANPANSVDSKYKIHVNVLSYNQLGISDIGTLPYFNVEASPNGFNGLEFEENTNDMVTNGNSFGHTDILLPSVVWNFHEKFAAGLLLRSRTFYDYNDVSGGLLKSISNGFTDTTEFNDQNPNLNNTAHSWTEVGLNLSAVLLDANYHFVKLGGTFKYYMGTGGNELRGILNSEYIANGNNLNLNGELTSLNTFNIDSNSSGSTYKSFFKSAFSIKTEGAGFGGDLGLVYEWRPRETNRVDVRSNSSAVNKYKLKISASVLDFGSIDYLNEQPNSEVRRNIISLNNANISRSTINEEKNLISALIDNGNTIDVTPRRGDVTFALPRALHLNVDYIILNNNNYYVNLNYIKALNTVSDEYTNSQRDMVTVTPRYETRKFSVYLPINFETTSSIISAGLGVRYGPVTIGSASLSNMFTDHKMHHLYFGVSIPLMKELYR